MGRPRAGCSCMTCHWVHSAIYRAAAGPDRLVVHERIYHRQRLAAPVPSAPEESPQRLATRQTPHMDLNTSMPARPGEIERGAMLARLGKEGVRATPATLLRWRNAWLLPQARREGRGRSRGSRSYYPEYAYRQAWFIGNWLQDQRNLDLAGWGAWLHHFPVTPFARSLLSETCKAQTVIARRARALMRGPVGDACARRLKVAVGRSPGGCICDTTARCVQGCSTFCE